MSNNYYELFFDLLELIEGQAYFYGKDVVHIYLGVYGYEGYDFLCENSVTIGTKDAIEISARDIVGVIKSQIEYLESSDDMGDYTYIIEFKGIIEKINNFLEQMK